MMIRELPSQGREVGYTSPMVLRWDASSVLAFAAMLATMLLPMPCDTAPAPRLPYLEHVG